MEEQLTLTKEIGNPYVLSIFNPGMQKGGRDFRLCPGVIFNIRTATIDIVTQTLEGSQIHRKEDVESAVAAIREATEWIYSLFLQGGILLANRDPILVNSAEYEVFQGVAIQKIFDRSPYIYGVSVKDLASDFGFSNILRLLGLTTSSGGLNTEPLVVMPGALDHMFWDEKRAIVWFQMPLSSNTFWMLYPDRMKSFLTYMYAKHNTYRIVNPKFLIPIMLKDLLTHHGMMRVYQGEGLVPYRLKHYLRYQHKGELHIY